MVIFYSYNTDLGDGWEDADVHDDLVAVAGEDAHVRLYRIRAGETSPGDR